MAQPAADLRLALGSAGFALRGAAGALLRLAGGVLGLLPAGLSFAMNKVAQHDRLTLGTAVCHAGIGSEGWRKGT